MGDAKAPAFFIEKNRTRKVRVLHYVTSKVLLMKILQVVLISQLLILKQLNPSLLNLNNFSIRQVGIVGRRGAATWLDFG
jgi:hypothetical protein